jgi:hypothetical protein
MPPIVAFSEGLRIRDDRQPSSLRKFFQKTCCSDLPFSLKCGKCAGAGRNPNAGGWWRAGGRCFACDGSDRFGANLGAGNVDGTAFFVGVIAKVDEQLKTSGTVSENLLRVIARGSERAEKGINEHPHWPADVVARARAALNKRSEAIG